MNQEWSGLTQRLERLERENRWWKVLGVLGLVGFAAVGLMGQASPGNVSKKRSDLSSEVPAARRSPSWAYSPIQRRSPLHR